MNTHVDTSSMDKFFNPSGVVVIGASNAAFNLGATICKTLKEDIAYQGQVFAVNRGGEEVHGAPGFTQVGDIEAPVDLAVILAPAAVVPGFVRDCGAKGIRNIVIESSGFSEQGNGGQKLQDEINDAARIYNMRIIGPNCLGILDNHKAFCCLYGANELVKKTVEKPGAVSYVIQSGGIGGLVVERIMEDLPGVNKMVCIGNKSDVDESDFIDYFNTDNTKVIALYLENVQHGNKLMSAAMRTKKPILVFKSGRSEAGSAACVSHTAGLANNDAVFDGACKQAGIIRLQSAEELHALPKMFTEMPLLRGKRIALFTNSGAFGTIGADLLADTDLVMAQFTAETREKLGRLPGVFNAGNPVDIGPALPQIYLQIYDALLSDQNVDGLLNIVGIWRDYVADVMSNLIELCRRHHKPAALFSFNAMARVQAARAAKNLPLFATLEEAVRALVVSHQQFRYLTKKETHRG
ncbi:MAG: CoA-binding protein [Deltaproteobacteria bacterium]